MATSRDIPETIADAALRVGVHPPAGPAVRAYDAVIVGGGHNGLVAAAYLARAGRSVIVLERLGRTGGAAVSTRLFPGFDARVSRYAYLVGLLPQKIVRDLGLRFAVRGRAVSSYSPTARTGRPTGLLVERDQSRTRASFARLTGSDKEFDSWRRFHGMTRHVAERVFPTLTEPLPTRAELRARIDDRYAWEALFERPLGEAIEAAFDDDLVRGMVLTDALVGTFAHAHDTTLRQNRCFLYHVIGGGTGDWNVPVGGMGALADALADAARSAGAHILTECEATHIATDGRTAEVTSTRGTFAARHVLVNASPHELARLLGEQPPPPAEGSQLKVNMLLRRLPRLRDTAVEPHTAFAGTFHISEGYEELETAYRQASTGRIPSAPPSEIYCHSLTDPSVLGPALAREGYHTLTLFGLHTPARLFTTDHDATRERLLRATLEQLDSHLAEPLADCLAVDSDGRPCIEAKSPLDLERELGLPGGNIFHSALEFPYRDDDTDNGDELSAAARWGVETAHPNILLCGSGAARGGLVSGIPGHNAAMAALSH
ncbi:phytoene desaturase family protein [Streptomyces klenkii]|uniref:phytoene desaturase family protein n=1 Tax=Streptomyces klenkii TaxID=1420899 RepID=UPI0036E37B05